MADPFFKLNWVRFGPHIKKTNKKKKHFWEYLGVSVV